MSAGSHPAPDWRPATPAERALATALERGDAAGYAAVVAETALLLPDLEAPGAGPERRAGGMRLPDGSVIVPAFTSPQALARALDPGATTGHRVVAFTDLAEQWPDPAWTLAIDPGLPIAARFAGDELASVVDGVFAPANPAEAAMIRARREGDAGDLLVALASAELHLPCAPGGSASRDLGDPAFPWWRTTGEAGVVVIGFTSERRLTGLLEVEHGEVDFVIVDLALLADAWPDQAWTLAVNPGSPMAATLPGDLLAEVAAEVARAREEPPPAGPAPATPPRAGSRPGDAAPPA